MIAYLEGTILQRSEDRIILLANQVGYDVLLPVTVQAELANIPEDTAITLHIYHHQTERQPKPVLIGFRKESEKSFFHHFISVEAIGPLKAVKALTMPVPAIADAIERKDITFLTKLNGIGKRTAQKMVATLEGKLQEFLEAELPATAPSAALDQSHRQVLDVLVEQLGHKPAEARQLIAEALSRNPEIRSPEDLFEEIYRMEKT